MAGGEAFAQRVPGSPTRDVPTAGPAQAGGPPGPGMGIETPGFGMPSFLIQRL